jgi:hypothetical protein
MKQVLLSMRSRKTEPFLDPDGAGTGLAFSRPKNLSRTTEEDEQNPHRHRPKPTVFVSVNPSHPHRLTLQSPIEPFTPTQINTAEPYRTLHTHTD